ncbi:glycerophosphodiester phosphodiesterase [Undibacterium fentianense]|uniref:Glycerophosphodiester phosphodiesterase n=1 Tax=Undibacterium fentianense TaxID=2828728 RepID=A0A941E5T9_9BURK|nr:glycerophosphodiester phosphodiesterase [Undibacterium fentianense]MBR7799298.1 glycerophosphodiester phosphodiesterase [Undibacterium fentianense]
MWPYPKVVAHRGAGIFAPENTLVAMQYGYEHGFRAVEFDVMLSKDRVPVLMHDPDFGRTIAGVGTVSSTFARTLIEMDAGSWFDARYANVRVPLYEDIFKYCREKGIWMNVEIKPAPGYEVETGEVVAELTQTWLQQFDSTAQAPLFSSFSESALMAAKRQAPDIPRGLLLDEFSPNWRVQIEKTGAIALHTNQQHLTANWAKQIKDRGFGLFCYTVNEVERAHEISSWGVDGFCTDRLDLFDASFD